MDDVDKLFDGCDRMDGYNSGEVLHLFTTFKMYMSKERARERAFELYHAAKNVTFGISVLKPIHMEQHDDRK
jgi:hypothetical protein